MGVLCSRTNCTPGRPCAFRVSLIHLAVENTGRVSKSSKYPPQKPPNQIKSSPQLPTCRTLFTAALCPAGTDPSSSAAKSLIRNEITPSFTPSLGCHLACCVWSCARGEAEATREPAKGLLQPRPLRGCRGLLLLPAVPGAFLFAVAFCIPTANAAVGRDEGWDER